MPTNKFDIQEGRIHYIEPNLVSIDGNLAPLDSATYNPEDYSIFVDLLVETHDRFHPEVGSVLSASWNGSAKNIMSGSRLTFSEKRFLTTNILNNTFNDVQEDINEEGLCIDSISIAYNSYNFPEINIKFTDVRGISLLAPSDYYDSTPKSENQNKFYSKAFISSFFMFPYPRFILQVKGFYGEPVSYTLCVSDFKTSFNSSTGNFDINVKFIGYMFGFMTDIPIRYLIWAPYDTYKGAEYWDEAKFEFSSLMTDSEGRKVVRRIPKLARVGSKIKELTSIIQESSTVQATANEITQLAKDMNVIKDVNSLATQVYNGNYKVSIAPQYITAGGVGTAVQTQDIASAMTEPIFIKEDIDDWHINLLFDSNVSTFKKINGELYSVKINDRPEQEIKAELQNKLDKELPLQVKNNSKAFNPTAYEYLNWEFLNSQVIPFFKVDVEDTKWVNPILNPNLAENLPLYLAQYKDEIKELYNKILNNTTVLNQKATHPGVFYAAFYKKSDLEIKDEEYEEENNAQQTVLANALKENLTKKLGEGLQFEPTIKNIIEMVLAHLETFLHIILYCDDRIRDPERGWPASLALEETDIASTTKTTFLPPFFAYFQPKDKNSSEKVESWFDEDKEDFAHLEEVELINGFLNGIYEKNKDEKAGAEEARNFIETQKTFSETTSNNMGGLIIDAINKKNPYDNFLNSANTGTTLINSMQDWFGLRYVLNRIYNGSDFNFAELEAKTFQNSEIFKKPTDEFNSLFVDRDGGSFVQRVEASNTGLQIGDTKESLIKNSKINLGNSEGLRIQLCPLNLARNDDFVETLPPGKEASDWNNSKYISINNISIAPDKDVETFSLKYPNSQFVSTSNDWFRDKGNLSGFQKKTLFGEVSRNGKDVISFGSAPSVNERNLQTEINISGQTADNIYKFLSTREPNTYVYTSGHSVELTAESVQNKKLYVPGLFVNETESLFASKLYYLQNLAPAVSEVKEYYGCTTPEDVVLARKAFLFVNSLPSVMHPHRIMELLLSKPAPLYGFLPKGHMLWLGSLCWEELCRLNKINPIKVGTSEKNDYISPTYFSQSWFNLDKEENPTALGNLNVLYSGSTNNYRQVIARPENCDIVNISILRAYANYFIDWAKSQMASFEQKFGFAGVNESNCEKIESYLENGKLKNQNYCKIAHNNNSKGCLLMFSNSQDVQSIIDCMFDYTEVKIAIPRNLVFYKNKTYANLFLKNIVITQAELKQAWSTFIDKVKDGHDAEERKIRANEATARRIQKSELTPDVKLATYQVFRNLYNKWILSLYSNIKAGDYDFKGKFRKRFVFINSFFETIDNLPIDMMKFSERIENAQRTIIEQSSNSLYDFIYKIAADNNVQLLALPINIQPDNREWFHNVFRPMPYEEFAKKPLEEEASYVFIYTEKPSAQLDINPSTKLGEGRYKYENDSFTLVRDDGSGLSADCPPTLKNSGNNIISAFGVTFAKGNQSFFKNIQVSMDNPKTTEYSLLALQHLVDQFQGEGNEGVIPQGQSLFKIYSNYSYQCSVEMMGCPNIMPLMYFQLNNIPMFRGTYIIINVKHNITPGNMTTTFVGQRIAKQRTPIADSELQTVGSSDNNDRTSSVNTGSVDTIAGGTYFGTEEISLPPYENLAKTLNLPFASSTEGAKYLYGIKMALTGLEEDFNNLKQFDPYGFYLANGSQTKPSSVEPSRTVTATNNIYDPNFLVNHYEENAKDATIVVPLVDGRRYAFYGVWYLPYVDYEKVFPETKIDTFISENSTLEGQCTYFAKYLKDFQNGSMLSALQKKDLEGFFRLYLGQTHYLYDSSSDTYNSMIQKLANIAKDTVAKIDETPKEGTYLVKTIDYANGWKETYETLGEWYEKNIHTYQGNRHARQPYTLEMEGRPVLQVYDDCSSYVYACLQLMRIFPVKDKNGKPQYPTATAGMQVGSAFQKTLMENGFDCLPYDIDSLQEGDIVITNNNLKKSNGSNYHHTEIYVNGTSDSKMTAYSWGNIHDGINGHQGMPCSYTKYPYGWIMRPRKKT